MDERLLNDLLECSVCLERLDSSSKVLPCQHTFCRKCLEIRIASKHQREREQSGQQRNEECEDFAE
uniref:Uncharacterized protein n=1 Tax=Anopheles stephensi TaxID=30069 RepID=A0A182YK05_ANOST